MRQIAERFKENRHTRNQASEEFFQMFGMYITKPETNAYGSRRVHPHVANTIKRHVTRHIHNIYTNWEWGRR